MRQILEVLPGALLPDPVAESGSPGAPLTPPDDDDLLRPAIEETLFRVGAGGSLVGAGTTTLAKHLVWTFGPVHRAMPFPLQLRVELDGDRLVTVEPEVGFLHQGLEKAFEHTSWHDGFELVSRVSPLSPLGHELAWALVVERLCDLEDEVPERAQLWRTIALELCRVAEHLRVLACPAIAPADAAARRALAEAARGARGLVDGLDTGAPFRAFGGLRRNIHDDEAKRIAGELPRLIAGVREVQATVESEASLYAHLEGLGHISRAAAVSLGVTGPALRACGVPDDVRRHEPAFAGRDIAAAIAVSQGGCTAARVRVRLQETIAASDVIERALARLPQAAPEFAITGLALPPKGCATASLELPNGELSIFVVSDGRDHPQRVRIRGASSALAAALPELLMGDRIDDVIPVLSGLDLIGNEIDR